MTSMVSAAKPESLVLRVGGQSRSEVVRALRDDGVRLNAHAETLLDHSAFDDPVSQTLRIVQRTVGQLGLPAGGVQSEVFAAVTAQKLELCPLVTRPPICGWRCWTRRTRRTRSCPPAAPDRRDPYRVRTCE